MAKGCSQWEKVGRLAACAALGCAVAAFAGCAAQPGTGEVPSGVPDATPPSATVPAADKAVVFPAAFFELKDVHDPLAFLEARGYADVAAGENGAYTATVPADAYAGLVEEAYQMATAAIDALPGDADHPNVVAVDYDKQFATVTVSFSVGELSAQDTLVSYIPGVAACMYQQVAGLPVGCDVILVGPDGSELANTMFPVKASASAEAGASGA